MTACMLALAVGGCAVDAPQQLVDGPESGDERVIPAPTSSLFTPAPFAVPSDAQGFWAALQEVATRLPPTAPTSEAEERVRLQACDHLAQLADAAFLGDRDDYQLGPTSNLDLQGAAASCEVPENAPSTYDRVQDVLEEDPFVAG